MVRKKGGVQEFGNDSKTNIDGAKFGQLIYNEFCVLSCHQQYYLLSSVGFIYIFIFYFNYFGNWSKSELILLANFFAFNKLATRKVIKQQSR